MRYGSVCSGIEAASVAWHPLGWTPAFFSEIDNFPRAVLEHHYPDVPLHGDFTTIGDEYGSIDVLVGGTPCQSFSLAGLRGGLDDDRGNLALEFLRLAQRKRPLWVVWENVPGVLSSGGGRDFGAFLGGLGELGYGFCYRVLDAQHFGVPQRRKRVFVVGHLGGWQAAAAVLLERQSMQGHPAPRRDQREAITEGVISRALTSSHTATGRLDPNETTFVTEEADWPADVAATLNASYAVKHGLEAQHVHQGASMFVPGHQVAFAQNSRDELRLEGGDGMTTGALSTGGGKPGQGYPVIACVHGTQDPIVSDNMAHPLGRNSGQENVITHPPMLGVRRLTPMECERLQGFPDSYTKIPWRGRTEDECPDGPRQKALGNSMAVPVMRWIGERIQRVSEIND